MRACALQGWLRLGLLYLDDTPVAAQCWIVRDRTASIFSLAFDDRHAAASPGTVLTAYLMRHVIDTDRVFRVDFLIGDDAYKRDWMSHRQQVWDLLAFNAKRPRGLLGLARHQAARLVKRVVLGPLTRLRRFTPRPG
jgi:CelD/BcsL family acetyltransferase involved in cellulose biosynthesis